MPTDKGQEAPRRSAERLYRLPRRAATMAVRTVRGEEVAAVQWDLGPEVWAALRHVDRVRHPRSARRREDDGALFIARLMYLVGACSSARSGSVGGQEELQPNIDGLSFDEVLLIALVPASRPSSSPGT